MAARSFLSLFGADVAGAHGGLQQVFAVGHLAGAALVVAALALAAGRLLRSLCVALAVAVALALAFALAGRGARTPPWPPPPPPIW